MTVAEAEQAHRVIEQSRRDPVWFAEEILGCKLWDEQKNVLLSIRDNSRTAVKSGSGEGKSFVSAVAALWFLLSFEPATVLTTAPTGRQVKDILWREIRARHANARVDLGGSLSATILDMGGDTKQWFALGLATDEAERFQGYHNENVFVVVDEASGITPEIYVAIENPLSSGNTRLLLISNPTQQTGEFKEAFDEKSGFHRISLSAFDTPNFTAFDITEEDIAQDTWKQKIGEDKMPFPALVNPSWVADRYQKWGPGNVLYRVYVRGEFPDKGAFNLFNLNDIERALGRVVPTNNPLICALDVARYGGDESVFGTRTGDNLTDIQSWAHEDTVFTQGRTVNLIRKIKPMTTRIDVVGVGAGVVDNMRAQGHRIDSVNVGERAINTEAYADTRAEIYWQLSERFVNDQIGLPDRNYEGMTKLIGQLADIRYFYDKKARLRIESKEDAKKRGSKSPDFADMLALLMKPHSVMSTMTALTQYM